MKFPNAKTEAKVLATVKAAGYQGTTARELSENINVMAVTAKRYLLHLTEAGVLVSFPRPPATIFIHRDAAIKQLAEVGQ